MVPERIYAEGLLLAIFGEFGIGPGDGAVAVKFRPVAVPGWGAEIRLGGVVEAFTVAAEEEECVLLVFRGLLFQRGDVVG